MPLIGGTIGPPTAPDTAAGIGALIGPARVFGEGEETGGRIKVLGIEFGTAAIRKIKAAG